MTELTCLVDPATGTLVMEGFTWEEATAVAGDLLPPAHEINCARPLTSPPLPQVNTPAGITVRVARIYHGSLVDGPGRRSVVQFQGCPIHCRGCYVPETHAVDGGAVRSVADVAAAAFDPAGEPRDGFAVLGGEPFFQPAALAALLRAFKAHGAHTVVYSGYTLKALRRRPEPEVREALQLTDLLIDGPFIAALAEGAGEWRGSRNQRVIMNPWAASRRGTLQTIQEA